MRATRAFVEQALHREGLLPNKNLGQNFCVDEGVLRQLATALPLNGRTVLEIGPGLGGLTEQLLAAGARVYAVEKDGRLWDFLRRDLADEGLTLIHGDCLKTDYSFLPPDFVAAGNLPYCITADIGAYVPPPTVTSALVKLEARPDAPQESPKSLLKFAAACLRMRRKTLYNNLTGTPALKAVLESMGLPADVRGEALTPEQLLTLYRRVNEN